MPSSPPVSGCILPAALLCKNRDKVAPPPENFSARESSSNVQNRAFWKPLLEIFLKLLRTSINSHRSLQQIMPAPPPVSGPVLPAALLCKNRRKVETLFWKFSDTQRSTSSSEDTVLIKRGKNLISWFHFFCKDNRGGWFKLSYCSGVPIYDITTSGRWEMLCNTSHLPALYVYAIEKRLMAVLSRTINDEDGCIAVTYPHRMTTNYL